MGDNLTQAAKNAEKSRARFLRQAMQQKTPVLTNLGNGSDTFSLAPESPELQKAYLEQLIECAPEAISILDNEQRITRLNSEFTNIFGYRPEEALGQRLDSLIIPPDRTAETRWIQDQLAKGQNVALETKRQRKDGTLVDVFISSAPAVVMGKQVGLCVLYRDISEQKRAEQLSSALLR